MYHREARLPIDVELLPSRDGDGPTWEDYADAMLEVKEGVKPAVISCCFFSVFVIILLLLYCNCATVLAVSVFHCS